MSAGPDPPPPLAWQPLQLNQANSFFPWLSWKAFCSYCLPLPLLRSDGAGPAVIDDNVTGSCVSVATGSGRNARSSRSQLPSTAAAIARANRVRALTASPPPVGEAVRLAERRTPGEWHRYRRAVAPI